MSVPFGARRVGWCRWGTLGTHVGSGSTGLSRPRPLVGGEQPRVAAELRVELGDGQAAPGGAGPTYESEEDGVDDLLGRQHLPVGDARVAAREGEQPDAVDEVAA